MAIVKTWDHKIIKNMPRLAKLTTLIWFRLAFCALTRPTFPNQLPFIHVMLHSLMA